MACGAMSQTGGTLLEWVIGISLNAFLVLLVMLGIGASRDTLEHNQQRAQLMDRGRFVRAVISEDLVNASGHLPCASAHQDHPQLTLTDVISDLPWLRFDTAVWGIEAPGTQPKSGWRLAGTSGDISAVDRQLPSSVVKLLDPQSDVLIAFHHQAYPSAQVASADPNGVGLTQAVDSRECGIWLISDCSQTVIFQDARRHTGTLGWEPGSCTPGNRSIQAPLSAPTWRTNEHMAVYGWLAKAWFVGRNADGQRVLYRALFRKGTAGIQIDEMARGIETLQVEYGVSGLGKPMRWQAADRVAQWPMVRAVRFGVVVSTGGSPVSNGLIRDRTLGVLSSKIEWTDGVRLAASFDGAQALHTQTVGL